MTSIVDFFYGLGSRYSYLASTQIAALEAETGCTVRWRPLKQGSLPALRGANPFAGDSLSGQYEWTYRRRDAEAWAEYYGVPYREPADPTVHTIVSALAAAAAARFGKTVEMSKALFHAHFAEGRAFDEAVCRACAKTVGIDEPEFRAALDDPAVSDALDTDAAEAHRRGAFGVPTFFAGEAMFWGNDRLPLLRHHLGKSAD